MTRLSACPYGRCDLPAAKQDSDALFQSTPVYWHQLGDCVDSIANSSWIMGCAYHK